jgi:hypothetical protein
MTMRRSSTLGLVLVGCVLALAAGRDGGRVDAQRAAPRQGASTPPARAHVHGTPKDWRFAWPTGDPARGREVFRKLECYSCHEVRGERFPAPSEPGRAGPELSGMGPLHPPEYFAEAIINPGAAIEPGRGYAAADGSSKMPSYNDSMTVQEAIDVVAFLRQLRPPPGPARGQGGHTTH